MMMMIIVMIKKKVVVKIFPAKVNNFSAEFFKLWLYGGVRKIVMNIFING